MSASSPSSAATPIERSNESEDVPNKTSNSLSSSVSNTSTECYDQEPFATFKDRVLAFAHGTIWPDPANKVYEITVEHLIGGAYNRIIGLTKQIKGDAKSHEEYILRVPRFSYHRVEDNVAALRFVSENTSIPAPRVCVFDAATENDMGSPYMVQNRLAGAPLHRCFATMSQTERCQVAAQIGAIVRQMLDVQSHMGGRLVLPANDKSLQAPVQVAPWYSTDAFDYRPFSNSVTSVTVGEVITTALRAWKSEELRLRPHTSIKPDMIDSFITMTHQMEQARCLDTIPLTLAHLDLAPRNVMVHAASDEKRVTITGILDWDSAILGPAFMACIPPSWLWAEWEDDHGEQGGISWEGPDLQPSSENGCELKDKFEEAAGPTYMRFAYGRTYLFAKRLMRFIIEGLKTNEHIREARSMLSSWNEYMKQVEEAQERGVV